MPIAPAQRSQILPAWTWLVLVAAGLTGITAVSTPANVEVIAPLTVQASACALLVFVLWRRRRGLVPWFEIGVVYAAITLVYGVYPLVKFLVLGSHYFAPQNDSRW